MKSLKSDVSEASCAEWNSHDGWHPAGVKTDRHPGPTGLPVVAVKEHAKRRRNHAAKRIRKLTLLGFLDVVFLSLI